MLDAVFDDVGDAVVEPVEEQLEPGEHAWLDDRVLGEGLQPGNGIRAFGHGQSALSEKSADLTQLLLHDGVGLGAFGPSLGETFVDAGGVRREVRGDEALGVHDRRRLVALGTDFIRITRLCCACSTPRIPGRTGPVMTFVFGRQPR